MALVRDRDPDVIENHNLFGFDLPFLWRRAVEYEVPLALGRAPGPALLQRHLEGPGGKKARFTIAGRELIDTLVRVRWKRRQIRDRLRQKWSCRHQTDEERRPFTRQLARHRDAHAEHLAAAEVNTSWPARLAGFLLRREHGVGAPCGHNPQERVDEGLFARSAVGLAGALLPEGDVLAQARTELGTIRRVSVDLDEAEQGRDPPEEAEARSFGVPRGIRLVAEIGVVRVGRDLVVRDGEAGGGKGREANLLAELVEAISHGARLHVRRAG